MIDPADFADALALGADGIWYGQGSDSLSYPQDGNAACFQVEDSSFWFKHRNACIVAAVQRFPPLARGPIFDIGGGNGFVSRGLIQAGFEAVLVEPGAAGASNSKQRGIPLVICGTTSGAKFRRHALPAIGLFDVVEHFDDDLQFLASMRELLQPNGRLYATVPAYNALWSAEDESAGHFRRHTRASLTHLCMQAGFRVDYVSYFFRPLPLPILLLRALPYRLGYRGAAPTQRNAARDHQPGNGLSSAVLQALLQREVRHIAAGRSMAFGGSCLLVGTAV